MYEVLYFFYVVTHYIRLYRFEKKKKKKRCKMHLRNAHVYNVIIHLSAQLQLSKYFTHSTINHSPAIHLPHHRKLTPNLNTPRIIHTLYYIYLQKLENSSRANCMSPYSCPRAEKTPGPRPILTLSHTHVRGGLAAGLIDVARTCRTTHAAYIYTHTPSSAV